MGKAVEAAEFVGAEALGAVRMGLCWVLDDAGKGVPHETVVGAADAVPLGAGGAEEEALAEEALAEEVLGGGAEALEIGHGTENGVNELVAVGLGRGLNEEGFSKEADADGAELGDDMLEESEVLLWDAGDGVHADGDCIG